MKRVLCVALVLCLLPVCALSDYADMTDDDLKAEFRQIMGELFSRGIWVSDTIPAGFYIVGEAIPAGSYELTPTKHATVEVFPDMEHLTDNRGRTMYLIFNEGETFVLSLTDGMTVDLGATCNIKPLSFSW